MNRHYHVIAGLHGCLPSSNEPYTNIIDAKLGLKEMVRDLRDSGNKLEGSLKTEYFEVIHKEDSMVDYCEISECFEKDCLKDELEN